MIGGLSAVTLTPEVAQIRCLFRFKKKNYETKKCVDEKLPRRKYAWTKSYRDEKMQRRKIG